MSKLIKRIFLTTKIKIIIGFVICFVALVSGSIGFILIINQQSNWDNPQKIDLDDLPGEIANITGVSQYIKEDFVIKLINEIVKEEKFRNLTKNDINWYVKMYAIRNHYVSPRYIDIHNTSNFEIRIESKPKNPKFIGYKNIKINKLTVTNTDLKFLPTTLKIENVRNKELDNFIVKLFDKLNEHFDTTNIYYFKSQYIDIFKRGTTDGLSIDDIVTNNSLEITLISSSKEPVIFIGQKDITINLTTV